MMNKLYNLVGIYREKGFSGLLDRLRTHSHYTAVNINKWYHRSRGAETYNTYGSNIFDEDWDNLIILDACRYDVFAELNTIEGKLEHRTSLGSTTEEFVRANFQNRNLLDTTYISDNPWFGRLHEEIDSELYFYDLCPRDAFEGLVSHPQTVTDTALSHAEKFQDKRLVVHFLQPHDPYFDENGEERFQLESTKPHHLKAAGYSRADIRSAYEANLKYVLRSVEKLVENLDGKTIITSDHGELLGERIRPIPVRRYEHPKHIHIDELTKVPWLVIDSNERRQITTAECRGDWRFTDPEKAEIRDQLESLGYL